MTFIKGAKPKRKDLLACAKECIAEGDARGFKSASQALVYDFATALLEMDREIESLRSGYLADENGNEYVAVCVLKEKIRELTAENQEHLRLAGKDAKTIDRLQKNLHEVLANERALLRGIDEAPVVYGWITRDDVLKKFRNYRELGDTHRARLVRIEEIPKEKP